MSCIFGKIFGGSRKRGAEAAEAGPAGLTAAPAAEPPAKRAKSASTDRSDAAQQGDAAPPVGGKPGADSDAHAVVGDDASVGAGLEPEAVEPKEAGEDAATEEETEVGELPGSAVEEADEAKEALTGTPAASAASADGAGGAPATGARPLLPGQRRPGDGGKVRRLVGLFADSSAKPVVPPHDAPPAPAAAAAAAARPRGIAKYGRDGIKVYAGQGRSSPKTPSAASGLLSDAAAGLHCEQARKRMAPVKYVYDRVGNKVPVAAAAAGSAGMLTF